jgi:hypothetical protein
MALGCHFSDISRLRAIFPDLAVGNSRFRAPAMRGWGYSKQLIQATLLAARPGDFRACPRFFAGIFPV